MNGFPWPPRLCCFSHRELWGCADSCSRHCSGTLFWREMSCWGARIQDVLVWSRTSHKEPFTTTCSFMLRLCIMSPPQRDVSVGRSLKYLADIRLVPLFSADGIKNIRTINACVWGAASRVSTETLCADWPLWRAQINNGCGHEPRDPLFHLMIHILQRYHSCMSVKTQIEMRYFVATLPHALEHSTFESITVFTGRLLVSSHISWEHVFSGRKAVFPNLCSCLKASRAVRVEVCCRRLEL